jgi:hypothetical protein
MTSISRHYRNDHIKVDTFETRLAIYEDQIRGWFLDQARVLDKISDHAGFIILLVVLSYVEGHAIFYKGQNSKDSSRQFFKDAFKRIFPLSGDSVTPDLIEIAVDELYNQMRNGLFHTGMTRGKVVLSNLVDPVQIIVDVPSKTVLRIEVNPVKMLEVVEDHLSHYVMRLRNNEENELRENFDKAWELRIS